MTKQIIILLIFLIPVFGFCQNSWFVKLNSNPRLSWLNDKGSKINLTSSISATVGYEFSKKISIETGLYLNRVGYRLERTLERVGVTEGINSYILEGEIPVKQKFKEKFVGVPLQLNYKFLERDKFNLFAYSNLSINRYNKSDHKWWYYYEAANEFSTDNTFTWNGRQKMNLSFELGVYLEQKLFKEISILGGINYLHLFHKKNLLISEKSSQFSNVGIILGFRHSLKKIKE